MKVKDNLYPPLFVMQRKVIQFVVPIVLKIWPLGLVSVGLDTEDFVEDQKLNWSLQKGGRGTIQIQYLQTFAYSFTVHLFLKKKITKARKIQVVPAKKNSNLCHD